MRHATHTDISFWRTTMTSLRKILVVDDDPVVGKSFHRVLSQDKGYVVITAHNAAEALERMREQEYDLLVTDIKMPGMDGVELAERVRARQPWTPVVIVTGFGSADNEQRARAAGVSAFVHKPLSPEMIEEAAVHARHIPEASVAAVVAPDPSVVRDPGVIAEPESHTRNVALFFAAPFIGLAYAVMLPMVGAAMMLMQAGRALARKAEGPSNAARVAMLALAPLIGLAFVITLPVVGLATLAWTGHHAVRRNISMRGIAKVIAVAFAPLLGLAYFLLLPIIGLLAFVWVAIRSVPTYELVD
jgi:CheY-like chemotaxis protein